MNLDKGNYDAVLASSCADAMQKGAAYFGKAGFDIKDVINRFSETGSTGNNTTSTQSDFTIYMTALVGKVDQNTLTDMDNSRTAYNSIPAISGSYKDAQFYVSLVDALRGLSLLKIVLDVNGDGTLNTTCDKNDNKKPDGLDAMACALLIGAGQPISKCTPSGSVTVVTDSKNITITNPSDPSKIYDSSPNTYRGLVTLVTGAGTNTTTCPNPNEYKHLLKTSGTTTLWAVITTASGPAACRDAGGKTWPCPILDANGQPIEIVSAIDSSLNSAISAMNTSLQPASGATTTTSDVQKSIQDIKTQACPTGPCTSADIANYLQTYKQ
jgi:hypothetical protein